MTITSLKWSQKATATREVLASNDVRTVIANQLGVDVKRVTDEAYFTDDLGAAWLDRLELTIVIEDRFADVVITDEEVAAAYGCYYNGARGYSLIPRTW